MKLWSGTVPGGQRARKTLAVAMVTMTLAACGNNASLPSATSGSSGPVTLVVETSTTPWEPAYKEVIKAYEQATGNKVDLRGSRTTKSGPRRRTI